MKRALVTGAAGGIGAAIARRLAADGWSLVLTDIDEAALAAVDLPAASLRRRLDVRDPGAWALLADELRATGGLHALVLNAGVTFHGAFAAHGHDDAARVVGVNTLGPMYGVHALLDALVAARGHVVVISSMSALTPIPTQSVYAASKAASRSWAAALRMELAPRGVAVTCVLPGTIATPLLSRAATDDPDATAWMARMMLAYGTSPDRVAAGVARALRGGGGERLVGVDAWALWAAQLLLPGLVPALLRWAYARWAPDGRWGR